jgi:NAD(P)-dependent dehydrogenase (short-subunit alcohol dehydrogenase family)
VPLALASASLGAPEGVAKVLAFLASDDADYVRGTIFTR